MIIVSQDREHIVNFNNIKEIRINSYNSLMIDIYSDYKLQLGHYKTEERAKEVLQEIIKCYKDTNYEYENCWCLRNLVYEMPEE